MQRRLRSTDEAGDSGDEERAGAVDPDAGFGSSPNWAQQRSLHAGDVATERCREMEVDGAGGLRWGGSATWRRGRGRGRRASLDLAKTATNGVGRRREPVELVLRRAAARRGGDGGFGGGAPSSMDMARRRRSCVQRERAGEFRGVWEEEIKRKKEKRQGLVELVDVGAGGAAAAAGRRWSSLRRLGRVRLGDKEVRGCWSGA